MNLIYYFIILTFPSLSHLPEHTMTTVDDDTFTQAAVDAHNAMRREHNAGPLRLCPTLCAEADMLSAAFVATAGAAVHSDNGVSKFSVWSDRHDEYAPSSGIDTAAIATRAASSWYNGVDTYLTSGGGIKGMSGYGADFTRLVWKSSTEMGVSLRRIPIAIPSDALLGTSHLDTFQAIVVCVYSDGCNAPREALIRANVSVPGPLFDEFPEEVGQISPQKVGGSPAPLDADQFEGDVVLKERLFEAEARILQLERQLRFAQSKGESAQHSLDKAVEGERAASRRVTALLTENSRLLCGLDGGRSLGSQSRSRSPIRQPRADQMQTHYDHHEAVVDTPHTVSFVSTPRGQESRGGGGGDLQPEDASPTFSPHSTTYNPPCTVTRAREESELQQALQLLDCMSSPSPLRGVGVRGGGGGGSSRRRYRSSRSRSPQKRLPMG